MVVHISIVKQSLVSKCREISNWRNLQSLKMVSPFLLKPFSKRVFFRLSKEKGGERLLLNWQLTSTQKNLDFLTVLYGVFVTFLDTPNVIPNCQIELIGCCLDGWQQKMSQCLKIREKVSFNKASEASRQKLIKKAQNSPFWPVFVWIWSFGSNSVTR